MQTAPWHMSPTHTQARSLVVGWLIKKTGVYAHRIYTFQWVELLAQEMTKGKLSLKSSGNLGGGRKGQVHPFIFCSFPQFFQLLFVTLHRILMLKVKARSRLMIFH